jgi:hypothetical protein
VPGKKWSFFENGMPGLHLTINPQKPLPAEARVNQQFLDHGLTLSAKDRESILRGRDEGVGAVNTILDRFIPGFVPDTRLKLANHIVDALLDKSVSAQLSREAPTRSFGLRRQASCSRFRLAFPSPFTSTQFLADGGK